MDRVPPERRAPLVERLDPSHPDHDRIVLAHDQAMERGETGYVDPTTGYFVFTAQAHWDRGICCHSGCRHCPYQAGERVGVRPVAAPRQPERGTE